MRSRAPVLIDGGGVDTLTNNWLRRSGSCVGGEFSRRSTGSEYDLAVMVSDFIEIGSAGADSWCSSDADSGFSDLADQISLCTISVNDQYESDLNLVVKSLVLSILEARQVEQPDVCDSGCIIRSLVKLLQSSGYDAALCASKWQTCGKVPGGEHEYIDVIEHDVSGGSERYIIDIDFRSHFQIARAVTAYSLVLSSLPAIYVGPMTKLKQILEIMVEAAKYSLDQNSMPLPPWRSLRYLEAKWESPCQRILTFDSVSSSPSSHQNCIRLLMRFKSSDFSHYN